jgi:hypothetical protein
MDELHARLLDYIEADVLKPGQISMALRKAQSEATVRLKNNPALRKQLELDLQRAKQQKDNLILLSGHTCERY